MCSSCFDLGISVVFAILCFNSKGGQYEQDSIISESDCNNASGKLSYGSDTVLGLNFFGGRVL